MAESVRGASGLTGAVGWGAIAFVVALLLVVTLTAPMAWMMGWGVAWTLLVVVAVLVVLAAYWAASGRRSGETLGGSAERILDERYARGELTREQFVRMKEDLRR